MKFFWCLAILVLAASHAAEARNLRKQSNQQHEEADERIQARSSIKRISGGQKQARVFPGALAIKKLVLLKFKKIIPISLILLKSSDENEAELVPVYSTDEIPTDVQFIPTPNGISGHKDVQAIAVPNEFHHQLEMSGLTDIESIEQLLKESQQNELGEQVVTVAQPEEIQSSPVAAENTDELLDVNELDENQLLSQHVEPVVAAGHSAAAVKPSKKSTASASQVRRLSAAALKPQTTVEEYPIYLYSSSENTVTKYKPKATRRYRTRA